MLSLSPVSLLSFPPSRYLFLSPLSRSLLLSLSWPKKKANLMPLTGEPLSDALSGNLYANGVGHSDETPGFAIANGTHHQIRAASKGSSAVSRKAKHSLP